MYQRLAMPRRTAYHLLNAMIADGSYAKVFDEHGLEDMKIDSASIVR